MTLDLTARQFLVWSYAYYVLNESLVDDATSDGTAQLLLDTFDEWHPQFSHKEYLTKKDLQVRGYHGQRGWPPIVKHAAVQAVSKAKPLATEAEGVMRNIDSKVQSHCCLVNEVIIPQQKEIPTVNVTTPEKPVYSVTQLNTIGKCSMMYNLRYIQKVSQNRPTGSLFFGILTGTALQKLVKSHMGAPATLEDATNAYIEAFREYFNVDRMPPNLLEYCVQIIQGYKTFDYPNVDGGVDRVHLDTLLARLDVDFKAIERGLPWIYKGMDARSNTDRFLHRMTLHPESVYNGYCTLREAGLLNNLAEVIDEKEARVSGKEFDLLGYFDLTLRYQNDNVIVVEIKTSKPAAKMPLAASCDQDETFVSKNQQANAYHYMGKKLWGDKFQGIYYMNTSFKKHLIKVIVNDLVQARFLGSLKMMHKQVQNEIFLPACGTGSKNLMRDMCSVSGNCPYV
jgi:hypothetical protein